MAKYFLGIDIGTSGTKALLMAHSGRVASTAAAEHPLLTPKPGWSEQRPDDWWASTRTAVRKAVRKAGAGKADVAAIGLSGQMHGSVFLDKNGRCLANALLWNDQRTAAECREIEDAAGGRAELIRLVRNPALTGYQAPKILWLRKHRPRVFARVRSIVLPKDYIRFLLTRTLGTDVSDASGTLLFDVGRRRWSRELMQRLGLDAALFPPAAESHEVVGHLTHEAAAHLGLRKGIPVVAGAGDQPAAAVGTGVVRPGVVSATLGTSGVVFAHSDRPAPNDDGLLQSFCHALPSAWCLFGCMLSAGGSLQWARRVFMSDRLRSARTAADRDRIYGRMLREASRADCGDTLLFLPYLTGERCPYPHPHARGGFIGLTSRHERGDLVRAVVEGITLGMNRQVQMMRSAGLSVKEVRLAGGGARNAWWRQLQADIYGCRCLRMRSEQGSAMGAAILASVGAGQFKSVRTACDAAVGVREVLRPKPAHTRRYRRLSELAARAYESLEPLYRIDF